MSDDKTAHEILKDYYPLEGVVEPIVELAHVNPWMLRDLIELAIVYGIYAEQRKHPRRDDGIETMKDLIRRSTW
jgi:hypothetical protein